MRQDSLTLLLADDDPDDRMLALEAFAESHLANPVASVEDGEDLLDYLYHRGKYAETKPRPPGDHPARPEHAPDGRARRRSR